MEAITLLEEAARRSSGSAIARYGIAAASVAIAVAVRAALAPMVGPHAPYLPFALAIMVTSRFGGRGPGLFATGLSTMIIPWLFIPVLRGFGEGSGHALGGLALFAVVGILVSLMIGELREALHSIARAEAGLRRQGHLIELSHDAIITMDADRRISAWNAGAEEIYGWLRAEASGRRIHELLKTTGSLSPAELDEILRREGRWEGTLSHAARDGRHLQIESRQIQVRGEGKQSEWFLEINRDVTRRVQSEEALRESESFYRQTLESIPGMVFTTRPDGYCDYQSQQWVEYTGVPMNEHMGDGWNQLLHPEDRERALDAWRDAVEGRARYDLEYRVRRHDGAYEWFKVIGQPIRDAGGEIVRWFGVALNIEALKKAEHATQDALELRRLALGAAKLGAWEYRSESGDFLCDEQCRELLGLTAGDRIGFDDFLARVHGDDRASTGDAFKQAIAGGDGVACNREFRTVWADGSVHLLASHGRVFFQGEGIQRRALRFVGVFMEITERRLAEERLREAQKLESIGVLAGGVAHDFNNLITVITGRASLALEQHPQCEHTSAILSAAERAAHLTRQLLAYAGKGQTMLEIVDLSDLVERSKQLLAVSVPKRVDVRYRLAQSLPCVEADPSHLEQILMNLVINAGEAMPPKSDGLIEIATSSCVLTPELALLHSRTYDIAAGVYVRLEVADNGIGMDEPTLARIFEPFFSTKFTGRGLGLAAVHGLVRSAKGIIDVRTSPGGGTVFRVMLPASDKQPPPGRRVSVAGTCVAGSSGVLVVEDEEMVRSLACAILTTHGFEVMEARDGKEALRVLGDARALPSAVLLDLAMPVMGGDELVPVLARDYPGLKIILCSGYPEEEARRNFAAESVAGFLQKPYTVGELVEKIREVVDGDRAPRGRGAGRPEPG